METNLAAIEERCIKTLINLLSPLLNKIYQEMYDLSKQDNTIPSSHKIYQFQIALKATPLWNSLDIKKRVDFILEEVPELMDVLEAVFMVSAQLWGSVRYNDDVGNDTFTLQLPTKEDFIHKLIIEGAENIYYDPYLYDHRSKDNKARLHKIEINRIVDESCRRCLDKCFPRNEILKKYIAQKRDEINGKNKKDTEIQDSDNDSESGNSYLDDDAVDDDSDENINPVKIEDSDSESADDSEGEEKVIQINDDAFTTQQKANLQTNNEPLPPPVAEGEVPQLSNFGSVEPPIQQDYGLQTEVQPSPPTPPGQDIVSYNIED
jgi:hypothetical protein